MKIWLQFALVLLVPLALRVGSATSKISPDGPTTYPLAVRVELPDDAVSVGSFAHLKVLVRNTTSEAARNGIQMPLQAVVIRDVHWNSYPEGERQWAGPIAGSVTLNSDGTVSHDTLAQRLTELSFEKGLLLPGEELRIGLPMTPQSLSVELTVRYGVVAPGKDFSPEILLPWPASPVSPGIVFKYGPPTDAALQLRKRASSYALVKATSRGLDASLNLSMAEFKLRLPVQPDPAVTGGVTAPQALVAARLPRDTHAYYRPALSAWILVTKERSAIALIRNGNSWQTRDLPAMDGMAPDLFCADQGQGTPVLMSVHDELGKLGKRTRTLAPHELWNLLEDAREKRSQLLRTTVGEFGHKQPVLELQAAAHGSP